MNSIEKSEVCHSKTTIYKLIKLTREAVLQYLNFQVLINKMLRLRIPMLLLQNKFTLRVALQQQVEDRDQILIYYMNLDHQVTSDPRAGTPLKVNNHMVNSKKYSQKLI